MPSLRITDFGGIKPKDSRSTGNASRASIARDVRLDSGTLKPWRYPSKDICSKLDCVCSAYFQDCCIVVSENPCAYFSKGDTDCNRVFSTGVLPYPAYASLPEKCDCGEIPDLVWKRLGVPAPTEAPIFVDYPTQTPVENNCCDGGRQEQWENRAYAITFVNEYGEEGPLSPVSEVVVSDYDACATLGLTIDDLEEGYEAVTIRIYRAASGYSDTFTTGEQATDLDPAAQFFFVGEIPFQTGTFEYEDCLDPALFGEMNTSENNFPPKACLDNLDMLEDGTLVASDGKNLWFSSPWKFHAWDCYMNLDDCIETISVVGPYIYITTNSYPYVLDVRTSAKDDCKCCRPVNKVMERLPNISRRSVTKIPNGIMWATDTGLARMRGGGQVDIVTHSSMSQDDWLEWNPHRLHSVFYKGKYFGFNDHRGFIYDVNDGIYSDSYPGEEGKFTELSLTPSGAFVSDQNILYLVFDGDLFRWDNSDTFMPYTWRSKLHVEGGLSNYSAMKVVFHDWLRTHRSPNAATIRIYVDDNLRFTRTITCSKPFRLPKGFDGLNYEIEIDGIEEVMEIHMATSMKELVLLNNA